MEFTEDGIEAGLETVTAEAEDAGTRADRILAANSAFRAAYAEAFGRWASKARTKNN